MPAHAKTCACGAATQLQQELYELPTHHSLRSVGGMFGRGYLVVAAAPFVLVCCPSCGLTRFFSAVVLRIVDAQTNEVTL